MLTPNQWRAIAGDLSLDREYVEESIAIYRAAWVEPAPLAKEEREQGLARVQAFKDRVRDLRAAVAALDPDMIELLHRRQAHGREYLPLVLGASEVVEMGWRRYAPRGRGRPKAQRDALRWFVARLARAWQAATGKRPTPTGDGPFERFAQAALDAATPGAKLPERVVREVCPLMDENGGEEAGRQLEEILNKEPLSVQLIDFVKK